MKKLMMTLFGVIMMSYSYAQFTVKGVVQTVDGEPLPGATVAIKKTSIGGVTDLDGNYVLKSIGAGTYTFKTSFLGMLDQEKTINISGNLELDFFLEEDVFSADEVVVYATRANEKTPTTFINVSKAELDERNLGQDLPILLNFTPSVVTTSDAGAGVGYTGMRIRGSDATRINVTMNGIPINDSESHGVFWVNMPDLSSSVQNVQIQRGVGTSSNGAAAFGATVNLQTNGPAIDPSVQIDNSGGSFNTLRSNIGLNSGLIKGKYNFEGRISRIISDGYIDRSGSELNSHFFSGGYYGKNTMVKAVVFGGKEVTQQAWYGTPEAKLTGNTEALQELVGFGGEYETQEQLDNLFNSGRRFNYYTYDNEIDNYQQDHYQLHVSHSFSENFNFNVSGHYTYGRGYFEQYRNQDDFSAYGFAEITYLRDSVFSNLRDESGNYLNTDFGSDLLNNPELSFNPILQNGDTVKNANNDVFLDASATRTQTDLIRRRWLDNHFYGFTYSFNYLKGKWNSTLGGAYNFYDGDHFGEVIWSEFASNSEIRDRYYYNYGRKGDFNVYSKTNYQLTEKLNLFADLQVRKIDYRSKGTDNDLQTIDVDVDFTFFNPKFGATYQLNRSASIYGSFAIANREPVRSDFIDALSGSSPKVEQLQNIELGYRANTENYQLSINYYLMTYDDQLVLTGAVNDVGSSVRTNVAKSYRTGIELAGAAKITDKLQWGGNVTLSENKIKNFTEVVYDYGENFDEFNVVNNDFKDVDIAFSPSLIAASIITFNPFDGAEVQILSKYVGKQYLDNTQNDERSIDAYFVNDIRLAYDFSAIGIENIGLSLMINNVLNEKYSSNGYTWGYLYGSENLYQQNNYYPQAGINFLAGISLNF